jgi:hypothetical protein
MIVKAFCLYDTKTGLFATPFFMAHVGQAIRACQDLGSDLNTTVGRHPADYMLCELGTFDDNTGTFRSELLHHATVSALLEPRPLPGLFAGAQSSTPEQVGMHLGKEI